MTVSCKAGTRPLEGNRCVRASGHYCCDRVLCDCDLARASFGRRAIERTNDRRLLPTRKYPGRVPRPSSAKRRPTVIVPREKEGRVPRYLCERGTTTSGENSKHMSFVRGGSFGVGY